MRYQTDVGLVLRRAKYLEADVHVTLFLRSHGKVLALAKGGQRLKSRLKGLIEPFTEAHFQIYQPHKTPRCRLISGSLIKAHHGLRLQPEAFHLASQCCEAVESLLPFQAASPIVYDLLQATLKELETNSHPKALWALFVIHLLKALGHGDVSQDLLKWLSSSDQPAFLRWLKDHEEPPASLHRCYRYLQSRLDQVLPWRLKSEFAMKETELIP